MIHTNTLSPTESLQCTRYHWAKRRNDLGALHLFDLREEKKKDWLITLHIQLRIRCVFRHLLIHELSAPQFIHNHYNTDSFTPDSQLTLLTYKTPVISTYDTKAAFMALSIYTDYVKAAHLPSEVLFKPSIKIQLFFLPPLITALVSIFF